MTRLMLDTSGYIAFKRGQVEATQALRSAREILIPSVVLGELLAGFDLGARSERNREELELFLGRSRVRSVPVGEDTAIRYGVILVHLRREGHPIPTNDLWIAASAMEHAVELLTADRHFLSVPQILVRFLGPRSDRPD